MGNGMFCLLEDELKINSEASFVQILLKIFPNEQIPFSALSSMNIQSSSFCDDRNSWGAWVVTLNAGFYHAGLKR